MNSRRSKVMTQTFVYPIINLKKTGENFKRIRKEKGFTVSQICEAMGFENPQSVYKWQRGETIPSIDNFAALGKLLGIHIEDILVFEDPNQIANSFKDLQEAGPLPFIGILSPIYAGVETPSFSASFSTSGTDIFVHWAISSKEYLPNLIIFSATSRRALLDP